MTALRSTVRASLAVIVSLAVTGCASFSIGQKMDTANIEKIRNNVTTKQDIRHMFGEPQSKNTASGKESWSYTYIGNKVGTNPLVYIPIFGVFISLLTGTKTATESQNLGLAFTNDIVTKCDLMISSSEGNAHILGSSTNNSENSQVECGGNKPSSASAAGTSTVR